MRGHESASSNRKSRISRRRFLSSFAAGSLVAIDGLAKKSSARAAAGFADALIDRRTLVRRHNPLLQSLDPLSPLSVGNGEFAFTVDITGLQTFAEMYELTAPLCTMAQWGWHTKPLAKGIDPRRFRLTPYDVHGRTVGYATSAEGQHELYDWLRENPHRLHLGRIAFEMSTKEGRRAGPSDLVRIEQRLDLWTGTLVSRFEFDGQLVTARTAVDPDQDLIAVSIESSLLSEHRLAVRFAFPYGSPAMNAADWGRHEGNRSSIVSRSVSGVRLHREVDDDEYFVALNWRPNAYFTQTKTHEFLLQARGAGRSLEFVVAFAPRSLRAQLVGADSTFARSARHWQRFWNEGAAIDLSGSRDERAPELERRIVLSQYLTAIQCSGSMPPQETGLTVNSWYGKFHLEMHWWHAAHFALWNRLPLLEKSLGWYAQILPGARERARSQGYGGARWPKMVGPEGRDSPSPIGPLLIWQQPHPIFYAELCYQTRRDRATLERYREIVFESADFMASFAFFEPKQQRYMLGPPLIPAQENHPPRETWNPSFELAYWDYGLQTAQRWRERLGMNRNPEWESVITRLSSLPVRDGVYLAHENCPQTYTERNSDHPSMLGAFGMLANEKIDRQTMRRTLRKVMNEWQWDKTWGWDYPLVAMTAARLGETKLAVDALLMDTVKNRYLPNGHNLQRENLPCYLPGNGGLLYATAMMAAGWRDSPNRPGPGFPSDGSWQLRADGFNEPLLRII